ncbi:MULTISPECIES: sigma-70 family RNA polymerase sigma factor [Bacteroides]|uniref:RNA polymerase sigma factor n=1 Tax=Bacteroides TaxID=816 RepID=UPI001CE2690A|nr:MULTISPECIES: sigma-70 family RNA polymerase sigma factor [Bacteroides]MCA6030004.1 sigma-70 family RNA polymerase sigma factor [Bacteroides thetaiotaomicron]
MSDVVLWDLILKGDMKAMSLLYKKHYELLLNFGLKYTLDEEFVKDCIQDVFVKLCASKRLSSTKYVRSYLLTSLKHIIFDKLSSLKVTEELDEHFFELEIEENSVLETLFKDNDEDLQLSKKLINAYKSLPDNQRMAIYLRYVRGLSYKEMAIVLNVNPQSSMNLVSRALTSLRSKMTLDEYLLIMILFCS